MKLLHFFSSVFLGLGLAACGQSNGPNVSTVATAPKPTAVAPAPTPAKPQIALIMKTRSNPFFAEMESGAARAEKELNVALVVKVASNETSIEEQIQIVNDLVAAKVQAIVIAPGDSQSLVPALKKASDAGIKVVNIDNRLDPEALQKAGMGVVPFISVDNDAGAYKAGQFLARDIHKPTKAAILEGIRSADNARQRMEGAKRALLENPHIKLVASETANWKTDEARKVTESIFQKKGNADIKLLFAANDMMAFGAIEYLKSNPKITGVTVVGYDALPQALVDIKAGTLAATVDQQAAEQGYQGVALALRLLKNESVPPITLIDTRLITATEAH